MNAMRYALIVCCLWSACGCGRPTEAQRALRPDEIKDFDTLFARNCSGCHGAEGQLGPAPPLNDPLFLAIIPDAELTRTVSEGRAGTLMPAFARQHGGTLTDEQIAMVIDGIKNRWTQSLDIPRETIPPYLAPTSTSDVHSLENREAAMQVFGQVCGTCHGERGQGGNEAGPLRNSAFLSLTSDQALRRIVITGRRDLGMPDYRRLGAMLPSGQPLTNQQIADVVALLRHWDQTDRSAATNNAP